MPTVNGYRVHLALVDDATGREVDLMDADIHTTEHPSDHTGESWARHVVSIVWPYLKQAYGAADTLRGMHVEMKQWNSVGKTVAEWRTKVIRMASRRRGAA